MMGKVLAVVLLLTGTAAQAGAGTSFISTKDVYTASISTASATGADRLFNRPPESFQGQWFTTADGCSYSRAKAPGYPPAWYLIMNPHHLGQPAPHRGCARVL